MTTAEQPTRLSVNVSRDTTEALQEIATYEGVSVTEALRRLVGYGILVYRADKGGSEVLIRHGGVRPLERVVLID